MPASAIMTVRIDPALLEALKEKARAEGRTVSAEVVRLVQQDVAERPARTSARRRTMGMFPDFEAPGLEELVQARRKLSRDLLASAQRSGRDG